MPWTYDDPPAVAMNWTADERRRCVDAANAALEMGRSDEEAIFACIAAAGKEKKMRNKRKEFRGRLKLLDGGEPGEFEAVFATLNVIDLDNDVTVPGAFTEDEAVRIAAWGHNWGTLPVGKGNIREEDDQAIVGGKFFLQTAAGKEHYETVKALGELQEWSYSFSILDEEKGEFEGKDVNFLKKLEVYEVSPVMLGAGIGTHTTDIKAAGSGLPAQAGWSGNIVINSALDADAVKAAVMDALQTSGLIKKLGAIGTESDEGERDDVPPDGGLGSGKSGGATPRTARSSTLAARVAMELLELGSN